MKFLARIFQYIIWFVVTAGIAWVMRKAFEGAAFERVKSAQGRGRVSSRPAAKALFRDPVCGTYVAEDISYFCQQGTETLHFCSSDCLNHYRDANRLAAEA